MRDVDIQKQNSLRYDTLLTRAKTWQVASLIHWIQP